VSALTAVTPIPNTHAHGGGIPLDVILMVLPAIAMVGYLSGVVSSHSRGRPWPLFRLVLWTAGIALAAAAVVGPLADAAHDSFVAHMWAHLFSGMLAPLLLVLAAPATLALRTLDVTPARRLSRLLRSAPARLVAHPISAAVLSAGGLWLIYVTPVFESMQTHRFSHLLVHAHLLVAGYLFTAAVVGVDPRPHPPRRAISVIVLVLVMTSHGILAKHLYAHPPIGVPLADAQQGAQLMYYLGAWVEGAIIFIFCTQWYRAAGQRLTRPLSRAR
jgi:putative membrane protein